jgi:flagellar hook-length control protein FliK
VAQDIEMRLRVCVRDHGRVLKLSLRPPELGNLQITVVRHEGTLQAQIVAERPEAVRLLERALPQLQDLLTDRGLSLGAFDVAYRDDRRDAGAEPGGHAWGRRGREDGERVGPAAAAPVPVTTPVRDQAGADGVDLLA